MSRNQKDPNPRTTTAEQREQAREHLSQSADKTNLSAGDISKEEVLEAFPEPHTSSRQFTGDQRCHDDWEDIARTFSIRRGSIWDVFTEEEAAGVLRSRTVRDEV